MRFFRFINEARGEIKHLEHLEDLFLRYGLKALDIIKEFLKIYSQESDKKSKVLAQIKIDGSPAIVFGIDPRDKKFFISTKSAFNVSQKLAKSEDEIRSNFKSVVANKLIQVFDSLKTLMMLPGEGYQADIIFTKEDKKEEKIDGEQYISFKPNVITYSVKKGTDYYDKIKIAKTGIVVHTKYKITVKDNRLEFSQQELNFNKIISQKAKDNDLFIISNVIEGSKLTSSNLKNKDLVFKLIKEIESQYSTDFVSYMNREFPELVNLIMSYENKQILKGSSLQGNIRDFDESFYFNGLILFLEDKIKSSTKEKYEKAIAFLKNHKKEFINVIKIYHKFISLKYALLDDLKDLEKIFTKSSIDGSEGPEGIVLVSNENIVKIVDRTSFSRINMETWKEKRKS